jgi:hypothetical protein
MAFLIIKNDFIYRSFFKKFSGKKKNTVKYGKVSFINNAQEFRNQNCKFKLYLIFVSEKYTTVLKISFASNRLRKYRDILFLNKSMMIMIAKIKNEKNFFFFKKTHTVHENY